MDVKIIQLFLRYRSLGVMSLHIPLGRIFHSNALTLFGLSLREKSQLSTSGIRILCHLCSLEFFTRSLFLSLSHTFYPSVPVFLARLILFSEAGLRLFFTSHTCFMGISRLGRKICKLNGINEKAELLFFNSVCFSGPLDRRNVLCHLKCRNFF